MYRYICQSEEGSRQTWLIKLMTLSVNMTWLSETCQIFISNGGCFNSDDNTNSHTSHATSWCCQTTSLPTNRNYISTKINQNLNEYKSLTFAGPQFSGKDVSSWANYRPLISPQFLPIVTSWFVVGVFLWGDGFLIAAVCEVVALCVCMTRR